MLTESASQYALFMKDLNNHCILNVGQVELKGIIALYYGEYSNLKGTVLVL